MTPEAFGQLAPAQQVRRLARLAREALARHGLDPLKLDRVGHAENTTFHVVARPASRASDPGRSLILRIHRPGYHARARIVSELTWLEALRRETALRVPEPVPDGHGERVLSVEVPGVPEPRHVVMFHRLPGSFRNRGLGPLSFRLLGRLMARLHDHARRFVPPPGFDRPVLDADGLLGPEANWGSVLQAPGLEGPQRRATERVLESMMDRIRSLGREPGVFGLIHADLHHGNYMFAGGSVHPIDFDDCGFGHLAYDLAIPLHAVRRRPEAPELTRSLFAGYRDVRPLDPTLEETVPFFMDVRTILTTSWLVSRRDIAGNRELLPWALGRLAETVDHYRPSAPCTGPRLHPGPGRATRPSSTPPARRSGWHGSDSGHRGKASTSPAQTTKFSPAT